MKEFSHYFLNNIGSCMGCMRQSFQMATISWIATLVILLFSYESVGYFGTTVSSILSILWMAHLVVFAARNSTTANAAYSPISTHLGLFLHNLAFTAAETAVLYRAGLKDRFGLPLLGRRFLIELKNPDGSRTAYLKNLNDVNALVRELELRGFDGELINPEYWMSTDSCERSAASSCSSHNCDSSSKTCKSGSINGACRCQ